jgi:hypothetical protein
MKTLHLLIFIMLIGLYSCDSNKNKVIEVFDFKIPIINDTLKTKRIEQESIWLRTANYNPLYIGQWKDSIYISYKPNLEKYFVYDYHVNYNELNYHKIDSSGIILLIDTTKIISNNQKMWEYGKNTLTKKTFKAFPVFVVNTTKDTLSIGYGDHLPIIMEAIDNKGTWQPIEDRYMYFCGVGLNEIILPPNEFVVTSVPINKGKFKTKLRLRYRNVLSQAFSGTINLTQFDSEWDENGEKKPPPKE